MEQAKKPKILDLNTAIKQIKRACETSEEQSPFFFLVGAGISYPEIPLASEITDECERIAEEKGGALDQQELAQQASEGPMKKYSYCIKCAFPDNSARRQYLADKIDKASITHANLRLAHILSQYEKARIANIVVTPNFDNLLSRALTLFGCSHVICDHPSTAERIDPENNHLIQIAQVHGSHYFYDLCNLDCEICERGEPKPDQYSSMRSLLDDILRRRSPIVIGYSGWPNDVIMRSLEYRCKERLKHNLYWFCFRRSDLDGLPDWLKEHPDVFFVLPPDILPPDIPLPEIFSEKMILRLADQTLKNKLGVKNKIESAISRSQKEFKFHYLDKSTFRITDCRELLEMRKKWEKENVLPAKKVFDAFIQIFQIKPPMLTADPLGFYANQLKNSLPTKEGEDEDDIYSLQSLVDRIDIAKGCLDNTLKGTEKSLERLRDSLRVSNYKDTIKKASRINITELDAGQQKELLNIISVAEKEMNPDEPEKIQALKIKLDICNRLAEREPSNSLYTDAIMDTYDSLGSCFMLQKQYKKAIEIYDAILERCNNNGSGNVNIDRKIANTLRLKGVAISRLKKPKKAIEIYDTVLERFGEAKDPKIRETVAQALMNKGFALDKCGRADEEIVAYGTLIERFGSVEEPRIQVQVARALMNKGFALDKCDRADEAIAAYDTLIERFWSFEEPRIQKEVAWALFIKGLTLNERDRLDEAIVAYDILIERFGSVEELETLEMVANALLNKGTSLNTFKQPKEAIAVYDAIVERFGETQEPEIQKVVARALMNKGITLRELKGLEDEIAVYDIVVERFGAAQEPEIQEVVAGALLNKGISLNKLKQPKEAIAVYDAIVERFGEIQEPKIQEVVARTFLNKGASLNKLKRLKEAIAVYDAIVERFGNAEELEIQEVTVEALMNKGFTFDKCGWVDEAIVTYDTLIERFESAEESEIWIWGQVVWALYIKGLTLNRCGRRDEAIVTYNALIERFGEAKEPEILELVAKALMNRGEVLEALKRLEEARTAYNTIIARFEETQNPEIQKVVAEARDHLSKMDNP